MRWASRHLSAAACTTFLSSAEILFQTGLEMIRLAGPHTWPVSDRYFCTSKNEDV
ncbi:hypothetical protein D3C84_1166270 [compost metagenome]